MNQQETTLPEDIANSLTPILYPDDLYQFDTVANSITGGFSSVRQADIDYFHENGYLVIEDAFSSEEINNAIAGMVHLMDGKKPDFRAIQFESKLAKLKDDMNEQDRRDAIRKIFNFVNHEPRLNALAEHQGLLQVLEQIMDDKPVLFQDMALVKPPRHGTEKPWHQDCAYFNLAHGTTVVGVWIALDEATAENGCMHIIPGSHNQGPMIHFNRRDWQICDTDVPIARDTMVPLQPGGCLFWHGLTHHGSPVNHSSKRRRALQFHYKPASTEDIKTQERMEMFGSEGKDVDC
ncbi:phytanoyl-CoA dioxygenase family protein [Candidatus Poribacteria bacterium]|nr:phytanoyl-CoA dioxygenase family protein [Candidatus Poribacteria bacterium]MYB66831.1 phytanoyl-CoA dioxygenase family protein [Candidatus Poribacteria bacterium]MYF56044.1 phytanoyl-CoA dioxygenase family protein [Candidatus Poribacteria bacterium]MYI93381.1 phytanoyl-CoA dioxygenase family protein [Candidatus Poribacteria bacterium]